MWWDSTAGVTRAQRRATKRTFTTGETQLKKGWGRLPLFTVTGPLQTTPQKSGGFAVTVGATLSHRGVWMCGDCAGATLHARFVHVACAGATSRAQRALFLTLALLGSSSASRSARFRAGSLSRASTPITTWRRFQCGTNSGRCDGAGAGERRRRGEAGRDLLSAALTEMACGELP